MKRRLGWALLSIAGVLGAVACQTTNNTVAPPAGPETSGPANATPPVASSTPGSNGGSPSEGAPVAGNETTPDSGAKMCGCSLCAPLPSGDACSTDADCAPSTPCHATACVAKAKAVPRKPDQVCTMMMGCQTADANACTCWKGTCALTPRK
jgi:hypothetical protein